MATENLTIKVDETGALVVSRKIDKLGDSAKRTGKSAMLLKRALGGLAVAGILTGAVKTLAAFSQEMSTVMAITGATGAVFDSLRDKAKELGTLTRFSATQAAEGMTFLSRAGFNANEVLKSIGPTLQLAQAGNLALGQAADIASNVLTGFNIAAEDSGRVIDVLALAANSANTDVSQLGEAMSYVAPVSRVLGVSLEETAGAVQTLSDAGIQASRAGTNLTMVMRLMENPTSQQTKVLKELKLTQDDVKVSQIGLTQALKNLKEKDVDVFKFFGRSAAAAAVLIEGTTGKLQDYTAANEKAEGTAKRIADVMDDNLNGALLAVKSAFEGVILAVGDLGAENILTKMFQGLATILRNVVTGMDDVGIVLNAIFSVAADRIQPVIDQFIAWGVTGESLKQTLADVGLFAVGMLRTALQVLDDLVFGTQTVSTVLMVLFKGTWETIGGYLKTATDWWKEMFRNTLNDIIRGINSLSARAGIDPIGYILPKAKEAPKAAFDWAAEIAAAVEKGGGPLTHFFDDMIAKADELKAASQKATVDALKNNGAGGGKNGLTEIIDDGMIGPVEDPAQTLRNLKEMAEQTKPVLTSLEQGVVSTFNTATDALTDFVKTGKFELRGFVADVLSQFARISAQKAFSGIGGSLSDMFGGFATGGSFMVGGQGGTDSQLVAFKASPNERVSITTPGQDRASAGRMSVPSVAAPQVNLKIVNVVSEEMIVEAMSSDEGEQVILNTISTNSTTVKQVIS